VNGSDDGALPRRGAGLAVALSILLAVLSGIWIGGTGIVQTLPDRLAAWTGDRAGAADELDASRELAMPARDERAYPQTDRSSSEIGQLEAVGRPPIDPLMADQPSEPLLDGAPDLPDRAELEEAAELAELAKQEDLAVRSVLAGTEMGPVAEEGLRDAKAGSASSTLSADSGIPRSSPRISMVQVAPVIEALDADSLSREMLADNAVVDELLRLWGVVTDVVVSGLDCRAVAAFGLDCERGNGRWNELRRFDRPAALPLTLADGRTGQVVVSGIDDEHATLDHDGRLLRVPIALLDERWSGDYLMLWRPPQPGATVIGRGSGGDAVAWLRSRMASLPDSDLTPEPARYDANMINAIKRFQAQNGLSVDGVAGPRTLILLSNVLSAPDVPRLSQSR